MGAANYGTVKLPAALIDAAREEAKLQHRSLGGQVEHWAELGRALESLPGVSVLRLRQILEGRLKLEALPEAEQDQVFEGLGAWFDAPDRATEAYFGAVGNEPGAVGSDGKAGLVRRSAPRRARRRA
jgi:hypothetical protein